MKEKKKRPDRSGRQVLGGQEERNEGIADSLNLSSDFNPFINQNRLNAEFNKLFNSVVDHPKDLFTEYGRQVEETDDAVLNALDTDTYMEAVADPGGLDPAYEERVREENAGYLKPRPRGRIGRRNS